MGIDDFVRQIEQDMLEDEARSGYMKPTQYAKLRKMYPQRIYQAIRSDKLEVTICRCGSKVINVAEADEVFGFGD